MTSELYVYYTVLYRKISGLRRRYNTYSTNVTYKTRAPLRGSVSYRPKYDSDPALVVSRQSSNFSTGVLRSVAAARLADSRLRLTTTKG